jgi:hypothetical protein
VAWLNPRNTGVVGGLVESKEHWGGDYTKRWCREVDNFKWTHLERCGPWIKIQGSKDYPCIVRIRRNKDR